MIVLDASALIALIRLEPGAELVAQVANTATISAVNFCEVVTRLSDLGVPEPLSKAGLRSLKLDVVSFTQEMAMQAAQLRAATRAKGLSLGDRACLALALSRNLPVLTADRAWADLDIGVEIRLIR